MSTQPALRMDRVTRRFGGRDAVHELSLTVEPGTVLGLVGRNGAGKTTTLRLALGLLYPDTGTTRVLGLDPVRQGLEVRGRVSLLAEESSLYPWMRVTEILAFAAALHPRWDPDLADTLVERLQLDSRPRIGTLSRGNRAKVGVVIAVASRPELLLLDDPTAGLDPWVRQEVLQGILEALSREGTAVVYASHLVHDLERVADRIAYLEGGRIRMEGDLDGIKAEIRRFRAVFDGEPPPIPAGLSGVIDTTVSGRTLTVVARAPAESGEQALRAGGATAVEVESLGLEQILVAWLKGDVSGRSTDG